MTVHTLIEKLNGIEDKNIPVLVVDTRSGAVEYASGGNTSEFSEGDSDYGIDDMTVGDMYCAIYLG